MIFVDRSESRHRRRERCGWRTPVGIVIATASHVSIGIFFEKFFDVFIDQRFVSFDLQMLLQGLVLFRFERTIDTFEEQVPIVRLLVRT